MTSVLRLLYRAAPLGESGLRGKFFFVLRVRALEKGQLRLALSSVQQTQVFGLVMAGRNVGLKVLCNALGGAVFFNPDSVVVNDEYLGARSTWFIAIATTVVVDVLHPTVSKAAIRVEAFGK